MKQVVYVDVLICVNLFINYFILLATSKFLHLKVKRIKLILGSTLGAVYSLYILFPQANAIASLLIKLVMSITIVLVSFGFPSVRDFVKITACFYSINFVFCGIMFAIWYAFSPNGFIMNNGVMYFNISPMFFIFATALSYVIIRIIQRFNGNRMPSQIFCDVLIEFEGRSTTVKSKIDTGNTLVEPFSNLPVIVVEYKYIEDIIPNEMKEFIITGSIEKLDGGNWISKCRLVPFKTVSENGLLPAFRPDKIKIMREKEQEKEAYIAVCSKGSLCGVAGSLMNVELVS